MLINQVVSTQQWADYLTYLQLRDEATQLRCIDKVLDHPYFINHPSCQNRRYMDRESQYFIKNRIEYQGQYPITDAVVQLIFRKDVTYQQIKNRFGDYPGNVVIKDWESVADFVLTLSTPFTGAYLVPHRDKRFNTKVAGWLSLFDDYNFEGVEKIQTAEGCYNFFKKIPGFGDFLAMQFTAELGWLDETLYGGNEFVIPGNGAVRGLAKLQVNQKDHVKFLQELVKTQPISNIDYLPMTLMDYQNTFCEFDKFTRYLGGYDNQGRNRMKRLRKPASEPIKNFVTTDKISSLEYHKQS